MNDRLDDEEVRLRLIPIRLVVGAMIFAQILFALVATYLRSTGFSAEAELAPTLLVALLALVATELISWPFVKKGLIADLKRRDVDEAGAVEGFLRILLVGAAMAEGPALFGLVIYLLTGTAFALVVPALSIFTLLRLQPTPSGFRDFVRSAGLTRF